MITFTTFLNESVLKVKNKSLSVVSADRNKLVSINIKKFDEAFKKSNMFIGPGGSGSIHGRYKRFGIFVFGGVEDIGGGIKIPSKGVDSIEAPQVSDNGIGEISFTNGRHRYAWLRDNKADKIFVSMDQASIKNAKDFGYIY